MTHLRTLALKEQGSWSDYILTPISHLLRAAGHGSVNSLNSAGSYKSASAHWSVQTWGNGLGTNSLFLYALHLPLSF